MLCCFGGSSDVGTKGAAATPQASGPQHHATVLAVDVRGPASPRPTDPGLASPSGATTTKAGITRNSLTGALATAFQRVSAGEVQLPPLSPAPSQQQPLAPQTSVQAPQQYQNGSGALTTAGSVGTCEPLLQLLPVLTGLDGGWWDQVDRACVATAQHLGAAHACLFQISDDGSNAIPLAIVGPPAPPLALGAALSLAPGEGGLPSCSASALMMEQISKDAGRLLLLSDSSSMGPATPPEWRYLAKHVSSAGHAGQPVASGGGAGPGAAGLDEQWHFAAVAIPAGYLPMGVLSLAVQASARPAAWTPDTLHSVAALLSTKMRTHQIDLASRALSELHAATTVHQVVRILLGASTELCSNTTRIETQARVAFLQPDVESAAVFQSAGTELGQQIRRRLSEVLLVDTNASPSVAGGGSVAGRTAGGGGGGAGGSVARRSLGGNEVLTTRCPSVGNQSALDARRDSFAEQRSLFARGGKEGEEVAVCRGHSLTLKHTLLAEALSQGTGLCIADCNAYVQDSKAYPRDLSVSRGSAPCQSLALATSVNPHDGRPLLALYATYNSVLPQALLQVVVQELGQLLKAVSPMVANKVAGELALEWGHLRHQLLESMRNRSVKNLAGLNSTTAISATGVVAAAGNSGPTDAALQGAVNSPQAAAGALNAFANVAAQRMASGGLVVAESPATGAGSDAAMGGASSAAMELEALKRNGRLEGRASFSLDRASSPRGSSKLAPLIATLHERLKAAQASQMANARAAARLQDLESVRLLEQIGRGGYGVVYRGLYHGSEVAIKVIQEADVTAGLSDSGNQDGAGAGGKNSVALQNKHLHDAIELVASASMSHPNIVQVLTFFTDAQVMVGDEPVDQLERRLSGLDGVAELLRLTRLPSLRDYPPGLAGMDVEAAEAALRELDKARGCGVIVLVQEFCDMGTLKNAINQRVFYDRAAPGDVGDRTSAGRHLQLNLRAIYTTLLEIALALRHMHGLHMVHCDLKPQNVLLKSSPRDPRSFTAKLSDFGLAKMMAHDEEGQLVIDEAVGSGTLTHMAPESLAGLKQLNASIDLYSFGVLMWQIVCGTRLYQGLTTKQIIRGVVREGLRPQFPQWVPLEYRRLAERCWHAVPSERPTSNELVQELEGMVDSHSRAWRTRRHNESSAAQQHLTQQQMHSLQQQHPPHPQHLMQQMPMAGPLGGVGMGPPRAQPPVAAVPVPLGGLGQHPLPLAHGGGGPGPVDPALVHLQQRPSAPPPGQLGPGPGVQQYPPALPQQPSYGKGPGQGGPGQLVI